MSISSDLHKLAKFYADHPELPAPSVHLSAVYRGDCDDIPAAIAAFADDGATVRSPSYGGSSTATISRVFGSVQASMTVGRDAVEAEPPKPATVKVLSPAAIRQRASVSQPSFPEGDAA